MTLTAEAVHKAYTHCLIKDDEAVEDSKLGDGVTGSTYFHPERLEERRLTVILMLCDLPPAFRYDDGLNFNMFLRYDRGGGWTTDHHIADMLIQLGRALGLVEYPINRAIWRGVPNLRFVNLQI